jgi:hypothetical protein
VTFESAKPDSGGEQQQFKYLGKSTSADRFLCRLRGRAGWGPKAEVSFILMDDEELEIDVEELLRLGTQQVVKVFATIENIVTGPDPKRFIGRDQSNAPQVRGCCPEARSWAARADARTPLASGVYGHRLKARPERRAHADAHRAQYQEEVTD